MPEQPAPPVTIRDPSRPTPSAEVLVLTPVAEPWRATRAQLLVAIVVVLLVAAGTTSLSRTAAAQPDRTAERRLDAAAMASVVARGPTSGQSKSYFDDATSAVVRSLVARCRS